MPVDRDDVRPPAVQFARPGGLDNRALGQTFAEVGHREHRSREGEARIQVDCRVQLANGFIETPIAASAQSAVLEIPSRKIRQPISIVDPNAFPNINTLRGVQQRLAQLGFFAGVVDGRPSAETDEAVQSFKTLNGLGNDARIDESTRGKLVEVYGS